MNEEIIAKINNYHISEAGLARLRETRVAILSGITGAGKDTIIREILQQSPQFEKIITSTTRAPRENHGVLERNGVDYYFLTHEQALQKIEQGDYAEVANVHGNIYGSLISEFERITTLGKTVLTDIDYQGASHFLEYGMENLWVLFITPPSFEVWLARLMKRQGENAKQNHDELVVRFQSAIKELNYALAHPQFVPIINDVSVETAQEIIGYVENGTAPSDEEITAGRAAIIELRDSIAHYLEQFND